MNSVAEDNTSLQYTVWYNKIQYNTVQYNAIHNTIQYDIMRDTKVIECYSVQHSAMSYVMKLDVTTLH